MPPKPRISREQILEAAYGLALRDGFSALSSRNVANAAGCSVQPVFSHFPTMYSLRQEIYHYACQKSAEEVLCDESGQDLLTVITCWMLDLARNRPNLFEILYISDLHEPQHMPEALMQAASHKKMRDRISKIHNLSAEDSEDILIRTCILLMGIGTMICINKVDMPESTALRIMQNSVDGFVAGAVQRANAKN